MLPRLPTASSRLIDPVPGEGRDEVRAGERHHVRLLGAAVGEVPEYNVLTAQARIEVFLLAAERKQVVVTLPDGIGWRGKSLVKRCLALLLESSEVRGATGDVGRVGGIRWSVHRLSCSR